MWSALDIVIRRSVPALLHPPDNSNDIALKLYMPDDNFMLFMDDICMALSNTTSSLQTWDKETAPIHAEYKEHLHALAEHINSMAHKITSSAWMLLEKLDLYVPTPQSVVELGELSPINYTFEHFNLTIGDRGVKDSANWSKGNVCEVSIIEPREENMEKLSLITIAAFKNLKSNTMKIKERASHEVMSVMHANADEMYHKTQSDQVEKEQLQREKHKNLKVQLVQYFHTMRCGTEEEFLMH
jgi:hypothetical protein